MTLSNYPPGETGGSTPVEIRCECAEGHVWLEEGFEELGATYFANEERLECPECGGDVKFVEGAEVRD